MKDTERKELESVINDLSIEQKNRLLNLSNDQRNEMFNILSKEQEERGKIYGDRHLLIEDLKKNHITIEEPAEKHGYKGKIVHINLPATGGFEGFKFDYFVSNESFEKNMESSRTSEWKEKLQNKFKAKEFDVDTEFFSPNEIRALFEAINLYIANNGVDVSRNNLNSESTNVKDLLGLFGNKRTKYGNSKTIYFMNNLDVIFNNEHDRASFSCDINKWDDAKILLKP